MKKKLIFTYFLGALSMLLICGVSAAVIYKANEVSFTPDDSTWNVTNVEDAINDIKNNYVPKSELENKTWEFDYTGTSEQFIVQTSGTYKLEVWGSQGGGYTSSTGGYGAYANGMIHLNQNDVIYITVGEQGHAGADTVDGYGTLIAGGYNGGGLGKTWIDSKTVAGGGGATHIALTDGTLSKVDVSKLLIAAGGGGGTGISLTNYVGGNAGGIQGNNGYASGNNYYGTGGSQTSGGSVANSSSGVVLNASGYGQGGGYASKDTKTGVTGNCSGGGAGYYGGGAGCGNGGYGGGGSSYIGNSSLTNKSMYCYNCTESAVESTKTLSNTCVSSDPVTNCSKMGNGYAKITLISID